MEGLGLTNVAILMLQPISAQATGGQIILSILISSQFGVFVLFIQAHIRLHWLPLGAFLLITNKMGDMHCPLLEFRSYHIHLGNFLERRAARGAEA